MQAVSGHACAAARPVQRGAQRQDAAAHPAQALGAPAKAAALQALPAAAARQRCRPRRGARAAAAAPGQKRGVNLVLLSLWGKAACRGRAGSMGHRSARAQQRARRVRAARPCCTWPAGQAGAHLTADRGRASGRPAAPAWPQIGSRRGAGARGAAAQRPAARGESGAGVFSCIVYPAAHLTTDSTHAAERKAKRSIPCGGGAQGRCLWARAAARTPSHAALQMMTGALSGCQPPPAARPTGCTSGCRVAQLQLLPCWVWLEGSAAAPAQPRRRTAESRHAGSLRCQPSRAVAAAGCRAPLRLLAQRCCPAPPLAAPPPQVHPAAALPPWRAAPAAPTRPPPCCGGCR